MRITKENVDYREKKNEMPPPGHPFYRTADDTVAVAVTRASLRWGP